jgi:hypothetical protein
VSLVGQSHSIPFFRYLVGGSREQSVSRKRISI